MIEDDAAALLERLTRIPEGAYAVLPPSDALVWAAARGLMRSKRTAGVIDPNDDEKRVLPGFASGYQITEQGRAWLAERAGAPEQ